jgi:hypothetical protein
MRRVAPASRKTSLTIDLAHFHSSTPSWHSDSPQTQTHAVLSWPDASLQPQPKGLSCQAVSPSAVPEHGRRKDIGAGSQRAQHSQRQRQTNTVRQHPFSPHPVSWVGDECESLSATSLTSCGHDVVEGNLDYPTWLVLLPCLLSLRAEG